MGCTWGSLISLSTTPLIRSPGMADPSDDRQLGSTTGNWPLLPTSTQSVLPAMAVINTRLGAFFSPVKNLA